jgi:hypothetical protein
LAPWFFEDLRSAIAAVIAPFRAYDVDGRAADDFPPVAISARDLDGKLHGVYNGETRVLTEQSPHRSVMKALGCEANWTEMPRWASNKRET